MTAYCANIAKAEWTGRVLKKSKLTEITSESVPAIEEIILDRSQHFHDIRVPSPTNLLILKSTW